MISSLGSEFGLSGSQGGWERGRRGWASSRAASAEIWAGAGRERHAHDIVHSLEGKLGLVSSFKFTRSADWAARTVASDLALEKIG